MRILLGLSLLLCSLGPVAQAQGTGQLRPMARDAERPAARWDEQDAGALWTRVTLSALAQTAPQLTRIVPADIDGWCPGYRAAPTDQRQAFWMGLISVVSYHESTHRPRAVGGDDQWFGLMQIYPPTAASFDCRAESGRGLQRAASNLSCAVRIIGITVPRDGGVAGRAGQWRGVAADWAPFRDAAKREDMRSWVSAQSYCTPPAAEPVRPRARAAGR